jgi:heme exporter protein D
VQVGEETYYSFKSVNYIGLVPVLVQAVKDQQQMIENLHQQLQEQRALITRLKPAVK